MTHVWSWSCTVLYCACNEQYIFLRLWISLGDWDFKNIIKATELKESSVSFQTHIVTLLSSHHPCFWWSHWQSQWYICHLLHAGDTNHKRCRIYYKLNFHLLLVLLKMSMHTNFDIPLFSLFCAVFSLRKLSFQVANSTGFWISHNQKYFKYFVIIQDNLATCLDL